MRRGKLGGDELLLNTQAPLLAAAPRGRNAVLTLLLGLVVAACGGGGSGVDNPPGSTAAPVTSVAALSATTATNVPTSTSPNTSATDFAFDFEPDSAIAFRWVNSNHSHEPGWSGAGSPGTVTW